jgi:hypothetical protein
MEHLSCIFLEFTMAWIGLTNPYFLLWHLSGVSSGDHRPYKSLSGVFLAFVLALIGHTNQKFPCLHSVYLTEGTGTRRKAKCLWMVLGWQGKVSMDGPRVVHLLFDGCTPWTVRTLGRLHLLGWCVFGCISLDGAVLGMSASPL